MITDICLLESSPLVELYYVRDGKLECRSLRRVEAEGCKSYLLKNDPKVTEAWIQG